MVDREHYCAGLDTCAPVQLTSGAVQLASGAVQLASTPVQLTPACNYQYVDPMSINELLDAHNTMSIELINFIKTSPQKYHQHVLRGLLRAQHGS